MINSTFNEWLESEEKKYANFPFQDNEVYQESERIAFEVLNRIKASDKFSALKSKFKVMNNDEQESCVLIASEYGCDEISIYLVLGEEDDDILSITSLIHNDKTRIWSIKYHKGGKGFIDIDKMLECLETIVY